MTTWIDHSIGPTGSERKYGMIQNSDTRFTVAGRSAIKLLSATSSATATMLNYQWITRKVADLRINLLSCRVADDWDYSNINTRNTRHFAARIGKPVCHGFTCCDFSSIDAVCHAVTDSRAQFLGPAGLLLL